MRHVLTNIISIVLITVSAAATSEARPQVKDKELAAYLQKQLEEHVRDNRVRAAIEDGKLYGIMIEGELKSGDYEAFVKLVKDLKGTVVDVYLYSPGGSAVEAIKIGRLIRKLKMHTIVPRISPANPFCGPARPAFISNCTCQSACFLMHVAGIHRTGNVLGIHRVYVDHDLLRNLSSAEALKASNDIRNALAVYFSEMGVPSSYAERVLAIPSGRIEFLTEDDIGRDFTGYVPDYQEWATAKCGDELSLFEEETRILKASKHKDTAKTLGDLKFLDEDYKRISEKIDKLSDCRHELNGRLAAEAFESTFR